MEAIFAHLGEELAISLVSAVETDEEHTGTVDREQGTNAVEFGGEDFEDDERKGELRQRGSHVGAFERALGGAHLDDLVRREHNGAGAEAIASAITGEPLDSVSWGARRGGGGRTLNMMLRGKSVKKMERWEGCSESMGGISKGDESSTRIVDLNLSTKDPSIGTYRSHRDFMNFREIDVIPMLSVGLLLHTPQQDFSYKKRVIPAVTIFTSMTKRTVGIGQHLPLVVGERVKETDISAVFKWESPAILE